MNFETLSQRLKTHGITIIAALAIVALAMEAPSPYDASIWYGLGLSALAGVVFVSAGGYTAVRERATLAGTAVGTAGLFYAVPVAYQIAEALVSRAFGHQPYLYVEGGRVPEPLWLEVLHAFDTGSGVLFWVLPPAVAIVIAKARPSSISEVTDLYWLSVPVTAVFVPFVMAVDALYQAAHPDMVASNAASYYVLEAAMGITGVSVILAVGWVIGLVAYKYLPDADADGEDRTAVVSDGGHRE